MATSISASNHSLPITSLASPSERHWFMHEMTHVWQHQLGYGLRRNAVRLFLKRIDPYAFELVEGRGLETFNMEQQACIVADYFSIRHELGVRSGSGRQVTEPALFAHTLARMLDNPSDPAHLPMS